jgi:hypothetical protein
MRLTIPSCVATGMCKMAPGGKAGRGAAGGVGRGWVGPGICGRLT